MIPLCVNDLAAQDDLTAQDYPHMCGCRSSLSLVQNTHCVYTTTKTRVPTLLIKLYRKLNMRCVHTLVVRTGHISDPGVAFTT